MTKLLNKFHLKVLRAILKLSLYSPIAPLYFLLGELPIEATLHLDVLNLFWNIWSNPHTMTFKVLQYLLIMAKDNSATWAAHIRLIFQLYSLPCPITLLASTPWTKKRWKNHIEAAVLSYHEAYWRSKAATNRKLRFFNVTTIGLSGRPHPILGWVKSTHDAVIIRPQIRMLAGDYQTYLNLSIERGMEPYCRICLPYVSTGNLPQDENLVHLLTQCRGTYDTRSRIMPELLNLVSQHLPSSSLLDSPTLEEVAQFLLDCTSLNLKNGLRISPSHSNK